MLTTGVVTSLITPIVAIKEFLTLIRSPGMSKGLFDVLESALNLYEYLALDCSFPCEANKFHFAF